MKGPDGNVEREDDSRLVQYKEVGRDPPLPELKAGHHLIEAMLTLCPIRALAMGGFRAADWPEIWPFMQATGAVSEAWEAEALHAMCAAYAAGRMAGQSPLGISPMERAKAR